MRPSSSARIACIAYSCGIQKGVDSIDSISIGGLRPSRVSSYFSTETYRHKKTRRAAGSVLLLQMKLLPVAVVVPSVVTASGVRGNNRAGHNGKCNKRKQ
jgi:hypothetical protein